MMQPAHVPVVAHDVVAAAAVVAAAPRGTAFVGGGHRRSTLRLVRLALALLRRRLDLGRLVDHVAVGAQRAARHALLACRTRGRGRANAHAHARRLQAARAAAERAATTATDAGRHLGAGQVVRAGQGGAAGNAYAADAVLLPRRASLGAAMRAGAHVGHQALVERGGNDDGILGALADEAVALEDLRCAGRAHDHGENGRVHVLAVLHGQLLHGAAQRDTGQEVSQEEIREGVPVLDLPERLEQGSLVNVIGVSDERQKGGAAIGIGDDELHRGPHGDVVEGRDAQVVVLAVAGVGLDAQARCADVQETRSQLLQR